jgi:lipoprotein-anchoring transpeptidase ErfK/SrfK
MRGSRGWGVLAALAALVAAAVAAPAGAAQAPRLPAGVIAPGVRIDGVAVGGLTRVPATERVLALRVAPKRRPLLLTFRGHRLSIDPVAVGYSADVAYAVKAALTFGHSRGAEPVNVPLRETVNRARVQAIVAARAAKVDVPAVDAELSFHGAVPVVQPARIGASVDQASADRLVAAALLTRRFHQYALPSVRVLPQVTSVGPSIVINRETLRLTLYQGSRAVRTFPVATGMSEFPTPVGRFSIIQKQVDPTWFPPDSPWAAGEGPVPPGVGNPLGTRWMGTSAPGIGIHGTPVPSSVGTHASHGCIRMYIPDSEWLYGHVSIGTPVLIV